jgi:hypothetical protein
VSAIWEVYDFPCLFQTISLETKLMSLLLQNLFQISAKTNFLVSATLPENNK